MTSPISSTYFSKALSIANTSITVAMNQGLNIIECIEASLPDTIQAIVDIPDERFSAAVSNAGLMKLPCISAQEMTPFSNLVIHAAATVIGDALSLKPSLSSSVGTDKLTELALSTWNGRTFTKTEVIHRVSANKANPNEIAEDGCGGACSI